MSEPQPTWTVNEDGAPERTTPTYDADKHYASVGRKLTVAAGFALSDRPPAIAVFRALKALGAAESLSSYGRRITTDIAAGRNPSAGDASPVPPYED